ncbi:MAG: hypothetical protein K2W82_18000 [Candidatus Obscuribacterales bacterium]|nr:hypothetical protein [Candidatus Obscuribacterales bacterium]
MKAKTFLQAGLLCLVLVSAAFAQTGLPTNVVLPLVFQKEEAGCKVEEIFFPGWGKKIQHFDLKSGVCLKRQQFDVAGILVNEALFQADGKLNRDFVLRADGSKLYQEYALNGKVIHFFEINAEGKTTVEKYFEDNGRLREESTLQTDGSLLTKRYVAKTGKLTQSIVNYPDKRRSETAYRADGKTVWSVRTVEPGKDPAERYEYQQKDGRYLTRDMYADRMIVSVYSKKDGTLQYGQRWNADGEYFRLAEVTVYDGTKKQIVTLQKDGVTVEKVEHLVSGIAGWTSEKVESGDKLEKPVDQALLKELNREDDLNAPKLAPPLPPPPPPAQPEPPPQPETPPSPAEPEQKESKSK